VVEGGGGVYVYMCEYVHMYINVYTYIYICTLYIPRRHSVGCLAHPRS
jgi:hypothetical protein